MNDHLEYSTAYDGFQMDVNMLKIKTSSFANTTDPDAHQLLIIDQKFTTQMGLVVAIIYALVFLVAIPVFIYVVFVKKRTEMFLTLTPLSFIIIGFVLGLKSLGQWIKYSDSTTSLWFASSDAGNWFSIINNFFFMFYNWMFAIQYFTSSIIFPKLIANSHVDAYLKQKISKQKK